MSARVALTLLVALSLGGSGCSFDDNAKHCAADSDCAAGEYCTSELCVPVRGGRQNGVERKDAGLDSRADATPDAGRLDRGMGPADASTRPAADSGERSGPAEGGEGGSDSAGGGRGGSSGEGGSGGTPGPSSEPSDTPTAGTGAEASAGTDAADGGSAGTRGSAAAGSASGGTGGSAAAGGGASGGAGSSGASGASGAGAGGMSGGGGSAGASGSCAPTVETCNGLDDNCDARVDEPFDLQTDASNCGVCGTRCGTGEACCAGRCTNTETDKDHCGACGTACTGGGRPACCSGSCTDLLSDGNCGQCGKACGVLGGVVCICAMTSSGIACEAPLLGLCL